MLCQKCGLVEAVVHRDTVVYRQKIEEHLCFLCANVSMSDQSSLGVTVPTTSSFSDPHQHTPHEQTSIPKPSWTVVRRAVNEMLSYSSELTRALPDIQFSSESFEAKVLSVYLFGGVMNAAFLIEGKWRFMTARTIGYLLLRRYFHRSPKEARMLSHELLMAAIRPRSSLQSAARKGADGFLAWRHGNIEAVAREFCQMLLELKRKSA